MSRKWLFRLLVVLPLVLILLIGVAWAVFHFGIYWHYSYIAQLARPSWTCDGKEIVFEAGFSEWSGVDLRWRTWTWGGFPSQVMKVSADGGQPSLLSKSAWSPSCSSSLPFVGFLSGKDSTVHSGNSLWVMDLNTHRKWRIDSVTEELPSEWGWGKYRLDPVWCWSPAGDRILYRGGDNRCYLTDPRGGGRVDILKQLLPDDHTRLTWWDAYWSDDGRIYLNARTPVPGGPDKCTYVAVNPENWQARPIAGPEAYHAPREAALSRIVAAFPDFDSLQNAIDLYSRDTSYVRRELVAVRYPAQIVFAARHLESPTGAVLNPGLVVFDSRTKTERIVVSFPRKN